FQRHRRRYDYWARRWDREAAWLLRVLRRKGAKQFVWVMLREPTPATVPRYAVSELSYYSWYFPYVNERLRRLDRRRDDVVLANWAKVGDGALADPRRMSGGASVRSAAITQYGRGT